LVGFGINVKKDNWVEVWNDFDHTPIHKNPNTKVYQTALRYITYLKNGVMYKHVADDFRQWCAQFDIDQKLFTKKWSDNDILKGLKNCALLYHPDYNPVDKKQLPSMANLIYDPYLNNSLFLLYHMTGPMKKSSYRKQRQMEVLTEKQKEIVSSIQQKIDEIRRHKIDETGKIIRFMRLIREFFEKNKKSINYNFCPNYLVLINLYIKWVGQTYGGWPKLTVGLLYPDRTIFKKYIQYLEDSAGVIMPSEDMKNAVSSDYRGRF
jgi:hypothetical protein